MQYDGPELSTVFLEILKVSIGMLEALLAEEEGNDE
jgi:hypothetical protein